MSKFHIGDRVVRPENVDDENSPIRVGVVARVYADVGYDGYHYDEVYEVRWSDDDKLRKGYLPHGIRRFPICGRHDCLRHCMPDGETIAFGVGERDEKGRFEAPCWTCAQAASDEKIWPSTPAPGSAQAVFEGCLCPTMDNHYGAGSPLGHIVNMDCPMHGRGTL